MNKIIKLAFIYFIIIFFSQTGYGQFIVKRSDNPKFIVGIHSSGVIAFGKDSINNKFHEILVETEPYLGYFPFKNLGVGLMFDYMYTNSNINNYKNYYSFGLFTRFYIPFQINRPLLDKQKLYLEYNINYTNYKFVSRYAFPVVYDKLQEIRHNFVIGLNIYLIKEFYLDIAFQYLKFSNGIGFVEPRLAIEYHFNKKNNDENNI